MPKRHVSAVAPLLKADRRHCVLIWLYAALLPASSLWGGEADKPGAIYPTPEACPRFAKPEFLSRPLEKAYPGIEYNIRPGVRGGTYPYTFTLEKSPQGMQIESRKGTVTWTPQKEGTFDVSIKARDAAGRSATQAYRLTVTRAGFYFVSPEGDDANPGTIEKPWKTVKRAAIPPEGFAYPAGAVVVFRGGNYKIDRPSPRSKLGGNGIPVRNDSPKYWLAYPGENPVIDFGWSGEKQQAAYAEQRASGKLIGGKRGPTTQHGYGHRIAVMNDYFYMDGFEVKNTCYYMFVMWHGGNTIHFRRCDFHHLWGDGAENPSFIFTFAGSRQGGKKWGVRAKVVCYSRFVIQDCALHDRFGPVPGHGLHGGAMTFYTVHDSLVEDCVIERVSPHGSMLALNDKDNGLGNTYRGNVIRGGLALLAQGSNDETEICYNYIEGTLSLGNASGWLRNIWVHHNTVHGRFGFSTCITKFPEPLITPKKNPEDASDLTLKEQPDYSRATTTDSMKMVRDFPAQKRFIFVYRNIFVPFDKRNRVVCVPGNYLFAQAWRYVHWDENLIDEQATVGMSGPIRKPLPLSFLKDCGFNEKGVQAPVTLDKDGRLPVNSPWIGKYGWQLPAQANTAASP